MPDIPLQPNLPSAFETNDGNNNGEDESDSDGDSELPIEPLTNPHTNPFNHLVERATVLEIKIKINS